MVRFAAPLVLMIAGGPLLWAQSPPVAPGSLYQWSAPPPPAPSPPGGLDGLVAPAPYGPPPPANGPLWVPSAMLPQDKPDEIVVGIRVEGNRAVTLEKILAEVHTHVGRPYDPELIQSDVTRLHKMRMFVEVHAMSQHARGGRLVIFRLVERPILKEVILRGNVEYKTGTLMKELAIKKGDAADPYEIDLGRHRLEDFYHKKGFSKVRVTVIEGNKPGDLRAVYDIDEGPQQKILEDQLRRLHRGQRRSHPDDRAQEFGGLPPHPLLRRRR